ncbi:MAG: glycerol-3-phosphate dehydrogenase, partial [Candidatus Cloacimonetes bacterium]|nr:glycerol-3-phosphate dehydrogenase [Candidatus Cloacimonadota bacterium]
EITRLGVKCGANPHTFSGISGIGDLIVTCESRHSRNRFVGEQLAKGKTLKEITDSMEMIAEGIKTTQAAYKLSKKMNVEMPITNEIYNILFNEFSPQEGLKRLMTRSAKSEDEF